MSNQGSVQAAGRSVTGTVLDYQSDWSALFDAQGIATGPWNGRLLSFINQALAATYPDLPGAMQAFAAAQGVSNWASMTTFALGAGGLADALLLGDGSSGVLMGDGSGYILMGA